MGKIMRSQILYQKSKSGAIVQWQAWNEGDKIFVCFGQVDGKLQTTVGKMCEFTNVGKINERNSEDQAVAEIESMIKKQLRLKYFESIELAENSVKIIPMLAKNGKEVKFEFPIDIQRKYDGLRCLTVWKDGKLKLLSRGNKFYNIKHIEDALSKIMSEGEMLDGELYIHGVSLQTINSWVRREQSDTLKIEYHVYDAPSDEPWVVRRNKLNSYKFSNKIKFVETQTVNSLSEIDLLHNQYIEEGFEGAILRVHDGKYLFGKRSSQLLKWKQFEDAEFKIVGIRPGTGKYSECPIFLCKNDINDKTFDVVPVGTMEAKKEMLNNSNIGKLLTVKFKGRSEDGIPKIAVGKIIRPKEDMIQN